MKLKKLLAICLFALVALNASARDAWLHIYRNDTIVVNDKETDAVRFYGNFNSFPMSEVDSLRFVADRESDKMKRLRIHYQRDGKPASKIISLNCIRKWDIGPNPPEFHITTVDNPELTDVESKTQYLNARLKVNGFGLAADFEGDALVRGRGNSTWNHPKKAYRLKLPVKTSLCGYRKAKNYVLLANYIDLSMMRNEVACLATQLVGMPYPTHAKPVDVYFNSAYKGSYMLIEKVGINNGSVNIPQVDEPNSIMFEMDVNYDETLRFKSPAFHLPVMHKDPDAPADPAEAKTWFNEWADDFIRMETAVKEGKDIGQHVDYTTLAKYLLVFNLCCNQEINHPKSIYLYKTKGGKYQFGPCWDFDWAFGYQPTYRAYSEGDITQEEGERLIAEVLEYIESIGLSPYSFFTWNGIDLIWYGGTDFLLYRDGSVSPWPYGVRHYGPSYSNYLLGAYKNTGQITNSGDPELGNGGEFFLSIIMDNPEFMAEYKRVWEDFRSKLDIFWEEFDAYAKALEPTAAKNNTVWENRYTSAVDSEFEDYADGTYAGAIEVLRRWVEKRLEFMNDPDANYGLYDPHTDYKRGTIAASTSGK